MIYALLRKLLFRIDAESAHALAVEQMEALQEIGIAIRAIRKMCRPPASVSRQMLGLTFPSPVGIAAGFDKNAVLMPMLSALGFGFIEVGTVTLRPQPGNPRPRLFRYPAEGALINRMGFNNDGADEIAERLKRHRASREAGDPPVFVNIGKNRDVPLEAAADAYAACYKRVAPLADAAVMNLSSPNTPGLRELQRPEQLDRLLRAMQPVRCGPLLVKIAPDLDEMQVDEIADVCSRLADGMICTNTTLDRLPGMNETGGLSGRPLFRKATDILARVRRRVGPGYPLIGVGGIFTAADMREKIAAGADLVQVYTGFIYEGPLMARRLARGLTEER